MNNTLNTNKMKNSNYKTMRNTIIVLLFVCGLGIDAQSQSTNTSNNDGFYNSLNLTVKDSLMFGYLDEINLQLERPRYQLFKTQNIWTFLKLDTMTGKIWQVQFSTKGSDYRFETPLDINSRIMYYDEQICGRFTLYATDNMYNFILLDQIDCRCWQVQWSTEPSNRGVIRIY